jgi:hypothetical protein
MTEIDFIDYNFSPIETYSNSINNQRIVNPKTKKIVTHGIRIIKKETNEIKKIYRTQK